MTTMHTLDVIIKTKMTLEQVEHLKDYLYDYLELYTDTYEVDLLTDLDFAVLDTK